MIRKLTEKDYVTSSWSGGKTVQIAISPEGAVYADRDFSFRVSSATVELPESDYTSLPDYDRLITPISGEMFLSHDGAPEEEVEPFEIHAFDGASKTHCRGICTDFNLMTRKGKTRGMMSALDIDPDSAVMLYPVEKNQTVVLYLAFGSARLLAGDEEIELSEGESLFITDETTEMALESEEGATFALACAEE